ncbi:MAG: ATP-dependent Clp protease adapter ClpS [Spirochaetaceae bacterium]|jgi:ATP-dependent Clp protease adaptor protein ClpS|nr:ATP-dependent Clp protease adapter ClpS [Spirochaetaceae bacterium]
MPLPIGGDTQIATRKKEKIKEPEEYRVILLNDHFTTMEFVVEILMLIFHRTHEEAERIMLEVHRNGRGVAGQYPHDIAQTKVKQVHDTARQHEFPLKCIIEPI